MDYNNNPPSQAGERPVVDYPMVYKRPRSLGYSGAASKPGAEDRPVLSSCLWSTNDDGEKASCSTLLLTGDTVGNIELFDLAGVMALLGAPMAQGKKTPVSQVDKSSIPALTNLKNHHEFVHKEQLIKYLGNFPSPGSAVRDLCSVEGREVLEAREKAEKGDAGLLEVCRDWEKGICNRGEKCKFAHGSGTGRAVEGSGVVEGSASAGVTKVESSR